MLVNVPSHIIVKIEELRQCLHNLLQSPTLTIGFHHQVLDETISIFKHGFRFMPVVGASAVVESCLMADRRRESKHETLQDYLAENDTLAPLIRKAELSRIPISELLDEDEDLDSKI